MRYTLEGYTNSYEIREEIDKTQRITLNSPCARDKYLSHKEKHTENAKFN